MTLKLQFRSETPLYEQLYHYIVKEIKEGRLEEQEKLPSKRALCTYLQISQSTVETAYDSLVAEGYLEARPRSGYYVCPYERLEKRPATVAKSVRAPVQRPCLYDFSTAAVDTSVFPYSSWAKLNKEVVYQQPELLLRGDKQGDASFREALCRFLHEYRGVRCSAEQIVVGAGMEYLLELLLSLLREDSVFALENPGYDATCQIICNHRRPIRFVGVDSGGMKLLDLQNCGANVAYVTPSHQFPMGVTMPVGRRTKLLKWANEGDNRYIIEDDYDSEFHAGVRPVPAMQGLDENEKVIYIGTFSRSIAPSIRVAYLCLPPPLLERYLEKYPYSASTVSRFEQQTLCRFLEQGLYARHLNRVGNLYRSQKNELLEQLFRSPLGKAIKISGADMGLHFLLTVENGQTEEELLACAKREGVLVRGLSQYYHQNRALCPSGTMVMGYAGFSSAKICGAVERLVRAWSY